MKGNIKAAVLLPGLTRLEGGLFNSVRTLAKDLGALDVDLQVFSTDLKLNAIDLNCWEAPQIRTAHSAFGNNFAYAPRLTSILADFSPNILHQHGLWRYPSIVSKKWSRTKTSGDLGSTKTCAKIISPRGMLDPWALDQSRWKKNAAMFLYERENLQTADCLHSLTVSGAEAIRQIGLKNPICIIPNGVSLPEANVVDDRISAKTKTLLFLGRIHPKKGLRELIQAWNEIRRDRSIPAWQLAIVGWEQNHHLRELKELADVFGITHHSWSATDFSVAMKAGLDAKGVIHFVGEAYNQDKEDILRRSDAFILPSFSEGMPMSVLEAWSYRLPAIITPFCNLQNALTRNAAIEVQPEFRSISVGIRKLTAMSNGERRAMSMNGLRLVEEEYSRSRVAREFLDVYRWLLKLDKNIPASVHFS